MVDIAESLLTQGKLVDKTFLYAVSLGLVAGISSEVKFGGAPALTSGRGDVWGGSSLQKQYVFPSLNGETIEAVSDDNADIGLELLISGLDENGDNQTVVVDLNGTTEVPVPGKWIAVNRAYNNNGTEFSGGITVKGDGSTSSNIFAYAPAVDQQTIQCPFMLARGKTAVINNLSTAVNKTSGANIQCTFRLEKQLINKVSRTQIRYGLSSNGNNNVSSDLIIPIVIPELTRMRVTANPTATTDISAEYSMIIIDNNYLGV